MQQVKSFYNIGHGSARMIPSSSLYCKTFYERNLHSWIAG